MFPGESYGVAVTVARLDPDEYEVLVADTRSRPTRLDEMLPADYMTDGELAREIAACVEVESRVAAYKAERIAQLAARRPASQDPKPGTPGAAVERDERLPEGVSEFFPDDLAMILNCSRTAATVLADISQTLVRTLKKTWTALSEGRIDYPRARALAIELGERARDTDPLIIAAVESAMLPVATQMSVKRLRAATRTELVARDAEVADKRRRQALRAADVIVRHLPDGMSELVHILPTPLANAERDAIDQYARMARAGGDERPLGLLRCMAAADLILRPWDDSRPPVTAHLTVLASLGALQQRTGAVAELGGQAITAAHARELLAALDALSPDGLRVPAGGSVTVGVTAGGTGELLAASTLDELRRVGRRGCPEHPGSFCSCPVLERPGSVDRYRSSPGQRRFVKTRDRTCRHPGCDNRAGWADLDHVEPHACGGPTDCANLCCLCRRHHRLKTHAPGWRYVMAADGTLTVTSPSGVTRTTRPPGLQYLSEYWHVPPEELVQPLDEDPPPF